MFLWGIPRGGNVRVRETLSRVLLDSSYTKLVDPYLISALEDHALKFNLFQTFQFFFCFFFLVLDNNVLINSSNF